jgi:hypothetical protein
MMKNKQNRYAMNNKIIIFVSEIRKKINTFNIFYNEKDVFFVSLAI